MDLELLKKFYVVAEEKSLSSAAKRLHTTQSALSRSMALFEYRLKTDLLIRTNKGVELTSQGERLYYHAKKIVQENNIFLRSFFENDEKIEGDLNVVAFPYLGAEWLIPLVDDFLETHPNINLNIHLDPENVNPYNYDVGIGTYIPNQLHLVQQELFPDYNQLFASEKYLQRYGTPQIPEDLDHHRLITYQGQDSYSDKRSINLILTLGTPPYSPPRKPYFQIDSLRGMINAVVKGYGIAELPLFAAVHYPQLKLVLPEIKGDSVPIYFIHQANRKSSRKIQAFYNYLWTKSELERKGRT